MNDESKHASSHFRPTPSCRLSLVRRPQSVPPPPGRGMRGRKDQLAETTCGHIRQNGRPNRPAPIPCFTPVRPGPIPIATQHEHEHEHDETEMTRALKCAVFVSSISPHAPRNETPMPTTTNEDERRRTGTRRRRMRKRDGTGRPTTWDRNASRPAPRIARRDERGGATQGR